MARGVIYILTNPSFPEYVKIGYAQNLEKRIKQLNRSETIPFAFRAYAIYEVDSPLTDKILHDLIDQLNPDLRSVETFEGKERKREFYAMSPEEAYTLLECIAKISGTEKCLKKVKPNGYEIKDEQIAVEIAEVTKRKKFKFSDYGIECGAILYFTNDESITVQVVDDKHILYEGMTTSMSNLARSLLKITYPVQGALYFKYNDPIYGMEKLTDRRNRIDKEV